MQFIRNTIFNAYGIEIKKIVVGAGIMTKEYKILVDSVEKVHQLQGIISEFDGDFDLICGPAEVDARSFLGIMTLDLARPLTMRTNVTSDELKEDLVDFIIG